MTAGWWEVCFSWMPVTGRGGCWARMPVERLTPFPLTVEMPELLQTAGVGGPGRNGTVSSDSRPEVGHQQSDQRHRIILSTVSLQFQVGLFPFP